MLRPGRAAVKPGARVPGRAAGRTARPRIASFGRHPLQPRAPVATYLRTTQIPVGGAKTLPRHYYTSPELFAEEHERIFTRRWLCVGREERLAAPGAYFLEPVGAESVIVLRDRGGELRAFYNVCRHRGTRLCS